MAGTAGQRQDRDLCLGLVSGMADVSGPWLSADCMWLGLCMGSLIWAPDNPLQIKKLRLREVKRQSYPGALSSSPEGSGLESIRLDPVLGRGPSSVLLKQRYLKVPQGVHDSGDFKEATSQILHSCLSLPLFSFSSFTGAKNSLSFVVPRCKD